LKVPFARFLGLMEPESDVVGLVKERPVDEQLAIGAHISRIDVSGVGGPGAKNGRRQHTPNNNRAVLHGNLHGQPIEELGLRSYERHPV
jgi:hypothetical protein